MIGEKSKACLTPVSKGDLYPLTASFKVTPFPSRPV